MQKEMEIINKGLRKQRSIIKYFIIFIGLFLLIFITNNVKNAEAADKKYGILIADGNGNYTFYDLYDKSSNMEGIETSEDGNIMVPLQKLCSLMPILSYRYEPKSNSAVIKNTKNNHKVIIKLGSKNLTYYSSTKAKPSKKAITFPMYQSEISDSLMVPMSALQWVMGNKLGYHYFDQTGMLGLGYDAVIYNGIIVYNSYNPVSALPKATQVKGISNSVKVTIPEGYSVPQVFNLMVKKGVCTSVDALYDSMEHYDFSYYPLVAELKENQNRCFKLEGYLYPDTYEFYRLSKSQDIIGKFLRNAEAKLTTEDRNKAKSLGYSVNDVLIIASLIEKETPHKDMMPQIASVIYNRLKIGMKIQFDSSIYYVERYIKPNISSDINRYNAYYNTYKTAALPSGPICNPGKAAIKAALNPAITDFLYFFSDADGNYHFSKEYFNVKNTKNEINNGEQYK